MYKRLLPFDISQDSVLGPLYEGVLAKAEPHEATLISSADDLAAIVVAKHHQDVELYASETIHAIKAWFQLVTLNPVEDNTEAVYITNRSKNNLVKIRIGNHEDVSNSIIR